MKKSDEIFIGHILESIGLIDEYIADKTKKDFLGSVSLQDKVIRRITVIGDAVKALSDEIKNINPRIPWKKIAGMRDIIVHQYFTIDIKLTWNVITKDLPEFKEQMMEINKKL